MGYNNLKSYDKLGKDELAFMIRTIRKLTALLLTLALTFALTFALLPGAALAAETDSTLPTSISAFSKGKTLRILAVGNSFSVDGLHYLYQMAKSAGYNVVIGNLYASGYSLSDHWEKGCLSGSDTAINDVTVYTYYKISNVTGGSWKSTSHTSMAKALSDEKWDVITLQQASGVSGVSSSYQSVSQSDSSQVDDYLSLLANYVKGECPNKRVRLGWQMTWAYAKKNLKGKTFINNYATYYGSDQSTMYQAIVNTVETTVAGSNLFSFCVPTGTAIQNARSSYAGDNLNRDGAHLSYGLGRYIAGMTWAAALGISPSQITYRPTTTNFVSSEDVAVSSLDRNMVRESVTNAIESPWSVTTSAYNTKPTLKATTLKSLRNASGGLHLTWSKVDDATGYQIYRKTGSGSFNRIETLTDGATTSYTDTSVKGKSGTTYTYYVKAYSGELITASHSNQLRMKRLTAPATVTVSNAGGGVKITWSNVAAATAYRVYRKTGSGLRTCVTTTSSKTVTYTDSKVKSKNGTSYTYDVVACSKLGEGAPSSAKTVTRLTGVILKRVEKSGKKLKVTWTRNSKATGYVIYRKVGSGSWSKVKTITKNSALTYTDGAVKHGKTYSYRVCAYKDSDNSATSNTKSIKR